MKTRKNKEFWATGIHPLIPSALRPKRKIFVLHLIIKATQKTIMEEKDKKCTLKARCTLTPLSLRSAHLTQYMRFTRCTSLSYILLRKTSHIQKRYVTYFQVSF